MIENIDSKPTESWLRRAIGHETPLPAASSEALQAGAVTAPSRDGWDPHEVWLRRIYEPRLRAVVAQG